MDKLAQLRQMRESQVQRGTRSLVNPRTLPSAESIKAIADRAQERSGHKIINGLNEAVSGNAARLTARSVDPKQGKTTKMANASSQSFDKSGYMQLYQRVRRAKNDDERSTAEAALRKAFPNVRRRAAKVETNGLSEVEEKALVLAPPKTIKRGSRKDAPRKKTKVPKLRPVKSPKRAVNGKNSRKAKMRKTKGRK